MAPLPLAIVGAGSIGMRHIAVALQNPDVELTAVIEPDVAIRTKLADEGLPTFAEIDAVPPRTAAAIIATPTQDHSASALAALARGWALLVEKPLAATLDEGRALIQAATVADLPLFTGHHRRCHPFVQAARDHIAALGDLVAVQGLWSLRKHQSYFDAPWRKRPGAGPLMTNLSHEIDLLLHLMGPISVASALTSSARRGFAVEDTAALTFRFASGALGSFVISDAGLSPWAFEAATAENPAIAGSNQDYLRITGTQGALAFPSLTGWKADGPNDWTAELTQVPPPKFDPIDPIAEQLRRFVTIANGGTDTVLCTGQDGLDALEWTLACALSGITKSRISRGGVPGDFRGI